jgi:hypothetical protein
VEINPENEAARRAMERTPSGRRGGPRRIAVVVARKWPKKGVRLSVSFMDNPARDLRSRILSHMNAWGEAANVVFSETSGAGQVRIARLDSPPAMAGFWSYIGTEILEVDENEPTLNLEKFTMRTSEAEFRRVVRHEAGHTLGFDHEHMRADIVKRIDREKAIAYFDVTDGWTPEEVEEQVLTPLAKKSLMGTAESDPLSIMCYHLPGKIMKDGKAVKGGVDINPRDFAFAASLYPKPSRTERAPEPAAVFERPLSRDEDVDTFHLLVMDDFYAEGGGAAVDPKGAQRSARVIASYAGARVSSALRLRAGKGQPPTRFGRIIGAHKRIRDYTSRQGGSLPTETEMMKFGEDLFETLLQGSVRRLYDEARSRQRRRLDFVLTSMIPWISEKPWEFAYDAGRECFLATEEIHFVRNVLTGVPADPVVRPDGPLRILVASAQPVGFGRLSIDQELEVIRRGFQGLITDGLAAIEVLPRATPQMIHEHLLHGRFQIVHFIGHGVYNEERNEGCLVFVNDRGGEYLLGQRAVREIFGKRGLSLVFLNSCESGRGGRSDFNKGVAQSLVAHGLPALVANQYSVLDSSASSFAEHFYACLAQGLSVGESAREARVAVNYSLDGEAIDWAVPVLYARDPGMTLCSPPAVRKPRTVTKERIARRPDRDVLVGVWDVDDVFPSIEKTLAAMNDAQKVFAFELTDVSAPLDVWDLESVEGTSYLRAETVARRLKSKAAEIGADVVACVTRHRLKGDDTLDLDAWWPDRQKPPVMIFSVAGFEELAAEGPDTDRAIANIMAAALAGFYGDIRCHNRGPKECPLWFDPKREYKYLVGRLKFDATCRKQLAPKLGAKLEALDALLQVFTGGK